MHWMKSGDLTICCIEVSLYILQVSRRELMGLDFEGILNFFRVTLPRKFQSEEECKSLFQTMSAFKVSFIIINFNRALGTGWDSVIKDGPMKLIYTTK